MYKSCCWNYRKRVGHEFWSDSGCRTIHFENGSVMCSCNHLSHFAILLSPDQVRMGIGVHKLINLLQTSQLQEQILKIVAQVLMPISLVFLLATILTFVLQKSVKAYYRMEQENSLVVLIWQFAVYSTAVKIKS